MEMLYRDGDNLYIGDLSYLKGSDGMFISFDTAWRRGDRFILHLKGAKIKSIGIKRIEVKHKDEIYMFYSLDAVKDYAWIEVNYRVADFDRKDYKPESDVTEISLDQSVVDSILRG